MFVICAFDGIKINHHVCRDKDFVKTFLTFIEERAMEVMNFGKKKMISLTDEELKSYERQKKIVYLLKIFEEEDAEDKKYCKVTDHFHCTGKCRGAAHTICNLRHSKPKNIPVISQNGSNYDYHFIIKELAKEFGKTNNLRKQEN